MANLREIRSRAVLTRRVDKIRQFYTDKKRMPSFSEIGEMTGLMSKNAVSKLVKRMEGMGLIKRDEKGRLIPLSISVSATVRLLGNIEAGFPSPAEEELADIISIDDLLIKNRSSTFMLKVSGDSMNEAGIMPGDLVLVDRSRIAKNGDIVIAEVDGRWTMKYLYQKGMDISLVPANRRYKPIVPENELRVGGVVTGVVRKYG